MARKRTALEQEQADRAYALSVAAALAASEGDVVHAPAVKKKPKAAAKANGNGRPSATQPPVKKRVKTAPTTVKVPVKMTQVMQSVRTSASTPMEAPSSVKKEKLEPQYEEPESEEVSMLEDEEEEGVEEEDEEEDDEEEEEEIAAPVVFQCGTCRSIFGDSYAFVCSNAELLLVTLSAVTNVALSPEAHTSREGADRGSSFHELLCKQCQTVLGRQYLTTPRALDALRSLYSFSTSAIASYQLGYPQLSQVENGASDTLPTIDEVKRANQSCDDAVRVLSLDRDELLRLREDMSKVQTLLVVVDERLHQLETQHEDSEEEAETQQPLTPKQRRVVPRSPEV